MAYLVFQRIRRAALPAAVAALLALPAPVLAQDAAAPAANAPAAAAAPAAGGQAQEPAQQWAKVCNTDAKTKVQRCVTSIALVAKTGAFIASFSIEPTPDPKKFNVGAFVPLGFVLPAGVTLTIDGAKKAGATYFLCAPPTEGQPAGCLAQAAVPDDFVAAMRKGNKLGLVLVSGQNQQIPIELTLVGFSKSFDGQGLDPQAARAQEVQNSKQLQEDARASFQRMIEKQRKENGTADAPAN
jgi:invasion protein IalB